MTTSFSQCNEKFGSRPACVLRRRRNDRDRSPAFKDGWIDQEGSSTGDLAGSEEIARVWRLGRRLAFFCADREDPLKDGYNGSSSAEKGELSGYSSHRPGLSTMAHRFV
ncbi:MAG: hypothetical protein Q8N04_08390 [Nitrospira sp.]|nr:hypothetical protein [Nitrospira sp.]